MEDSFITTQIMSINECGTSNPAENAIKVNLAGQQSGWVRLGDSSQDVRIWAILCAIKAAFLAGVSDVTMNAFMEWAAIEGDHFVGVRRVYIKSPTGSTKSN